MNNSMYSKFTDLVRGTKRPFSMTSDGWDKWNADAKAAHPWRYWIVETLFYNIEIGIEKPYWSLLEAKQYIENRFIHRTHYLPTELEKGRAFEAQHLILHGAFKTLVDFVEVDCARSNVAYDSEARKRYHAPKLSRWTFKRWRHARCGLDYLRSLIDQDAQCGDVYQAERRSQLEQILKLYSWWKNIRPHRIDPYDLYDYLPESASKDDLDKMHYRVETLETSHDKEDDQMLSLLITVRRQLWSYFL